MDLFSLVAKLTLNTDEYEKALNRAQSDGTNMQDLQANLDLDTTDFDIAVQEADNVEISDPDDPELDLNKDDFDKVVSEAEETEVDDPDEPELGLDNKPYSEALEQAEADTTTFEGAIGDTFANIKTLIMGAGIVGAITEITKYLGEAVDLARSTGDSIDKSSRAMSLSTDAYQEWSHVLDINGASITDLNRGLMNMRKLMGGGEPSKEFSEAMDRLGLSTKVANKEIKSTEDLLDASLKALADFEGSAEDRDVIAQALFGRGGTKLNAMFDGTSQDIEFLKQQAHDLGLVMSEDAVAQAAAYNDAVTNMNASIESFKVSIGETLLPIFTDLANKVATIVAFFNPRNSKTKLGEQMQDIDEQTAETILDIEATSGAAENMIDKLFSMGNATKLTAEQQAEWKATADWLINNIPSLNTVIDKDTQSIKGNKDEVLGVVDAWRQYAIETAKAEALKEKREALAKKTTEWLKQEEKAAEAYGEYEKQSSKVDELLKRDWENMSEANQNKFLERFNISRENLVWNDKQLRSLEMAIGGAYSEWGIQGGSYELLQAIGQRDTNIESAYQQWQEAKDKAADLKQEVEDGKNELDKYESTLDEVILNLAKTGENADGTKSDVDNLNKSLEKLPRQKQIQIDLLVYGRDALDFIPHAKGLWTVPEDNYPALLHRGERVLTASQARQADSTNNNIDFSQMEDRIVVAIREGMADANVTAVVTDRQVGKGSNRYNGTEIDARRFRP